MFWFAGKVARIRDIEVEPLNISDATTEDAKLYGHTVCRETQADMKERALAPAAILRGGDTIKLLQLPQRSDILVAAATLNGGSTNKE